MEFGESWKFPHHYEGGVHALMREFCYIFLNYRPIIVHSQSFTTGP